MPNTFTEPELSIELQQQGWKKFWSKRENRPYFWNKLTGESLWVMPSLKPQVILCHAVHISNSKRFFFFKSEHLKTFFPV